MGRWSGLGLASLHGSGQARARRRALSHLVAAGAPVKSRVAEFSAKPILAPDGSLLGLPLGVLDASPFRSFLWPGVLLFTVIGVVPIIVAVLTLQRSPIAPLAAVFVGCALLVWIAVEMVMLSGASSLVWVFYLVVGTSLAALGMSWFRSRRSTRHIV